jgi:hypothetical protein
MLKVREAKLKFWIVLPSMMPLIVIWYINTANNKSQKRFVKQIYANNGIGMLRNTLYEMDYPRTP